MAVVVREALTRGDYNKFINLPWAIYEYDPCWVPPLKQDMWDTITGKGNPLFHCGPHALFLAEKDGLVVGRIMVAIDEELNKARNQRWGYFSLFECFNDKTVASSLLTTAEVWLKARGATVCRGPVSPSNGDDYRGLLIEGFDSPPVLLNSYNPPYYIQLLEELSYAGDGNDRLAYHFDPQLATQRHLAPVIEYAKKRYKFRVDRANLNNLTEEFVALKRVMDIAMPEWPDMIPPTMEELKLMAKKIVPIADPDFLLIARSHAGNPIGFIIGLPDYNQVLKHLDGRLWPFGWLKFLWLKRRINVVRIFVLFVVPAWQSKGVSHAMFLEVFKACIEKGYVAAEGSTIVEKNLAMNRDAVRAGGRLYKRYRTYEKKL